MINDIIEQDIEEIYRSNIPWRDLAGKTILITGAYGMLASYLVYMIIYLNEREHMDINLIVVVRSKEKFYKKFGYKKNIYIYETELNKNLKIKENIDYIIHAASLASNKYYDKYPIEVLMPNVIGTYYLLKLSEEKNVKSFLYFSTDAIYGELKSDKTIKEDTLGFVNTLDITSCYSESKRMGETMCEAWFREKGVPIKIVRISHTYAPTMDIKNDPRVFSSFVNNIINKKDIIINSDGLSKRSFCYIVDAVRAYFLVLLKGNNGEAYNVCNNKEFWSIKELAEKLINIFPEFKLKVILQNKNNNITTNKNNICLDNSKIKKLGWMPKYTIEDGFKKVIISKIKENENVKIG